MSRKAARETALKLIYEFCIAEEKNETTYAELSADLKEDGAEYLRKIYDGVTDNFTELAAVIERLSDGFALGRIYKIDLSILLIALYELQNCADIPRTVSVSEAVNLAKAYSTEKSFSFINGVLAAYIKENSN